MSVALYGFPSHTLAPHCSLPPCWCYSMSGWVRARGGCGCTLLIHAEKWFHFSYFLSPTMKAAWVHRHWVVFLQGLRSLWAVLFFPVMPKITTGKKKKKLWIWLRRWESMSQGGWWRWKLLKTDQLSLVLSNTTAFHVLWELIGFVTVLHWRRPQN